VLRLLADENFNGRILRALRRRVRSGLAIPEVVVAVTDRPIGQVIGDLEILLLASRSEDLESQILFVPF
jgi:hypothetical protein